MATAQEYFEQGDAFFDERDFENAILCYSKVVNLVPNFYEGYYKRGLCYCKFKEYEMAIADFSKVIELDYSNEEAYLQRAEVYASLGKYNKVIEDYTTLIELNPYNTEFYYSRASYYKESNKYGNAVKDYTKIIAFDSTNADIFSNRAYCYEKMKEYQKAINDYTKSIDLEPNKPDYYNYRAGCYIKLEQNGKGMQDLSTCIEKIKNMKTSWTLDKELSYQRVLDKLIYIEKFDLATILRLEYMSTSEGYEGKYYRNRALTCVQLKKYSMAIDYLNKALEYHGRGICDNSVEIYCDIAKCYNILGKHEDAHKAYNNAIDCCTNVIKYRVDDLFLQKNYLWRSDCYKAIGEYDKALADLAKANTIPERSHEEIFAENYFDKAKYYELINKPDIAKKYYVKTLERCHEKDIDYSYSEQCNLVAKCYEKIGEISIAIEIRYRTIENYTKKIEEYYDFTNYTIRARLYKEMENYEKAIDDFTNCIEDYGVGCYILRANCYEEIGDYEKAVNDYKKALVYEGDSISNVLEIQNKLEKLSKITTSCIEIFDNQKLIMDLVETPFNKVEDEYNEFDSEEYYDNEELKYEYEYEDEYEDEENMDIIIDHKFSENKFDKWKEQIENTIKAIREGRGNSDMIMAEFLRAYAIDNEETVRVLKNITDNPKCPETEQKLCLYILDLVSLFGKRVSNMSDEEKFEFVEQFLEEQKNCCSIDFSKLHYNPTQGRKLDL